MTAHINPEDKKCINGNVSVQLYAKTLSFMHFNFYLCALENEPVKKQ